MELQQGNAHKQFENQLGVKNKELLELQEAYKEKLRKCQAWEKASNKFPGKKLFIIAVYRLTTTFELS
jgi:hypothetical protein